MHERLNCSLVECGITQPNGYERAEAQCCEEEEDVAFFRLISSTQQFLQRQEA